MKEVQCVINQLRLNRQCLVRQGMKRPGNLALLSVCMCCVRTILNELAFDISVSSSCSECFIDINCTRWADPVL